MVRFILQVRTDKPIQRANQQTWTLLSKLGIYTNFATTEVWRTADEFRTERIQYNADVNHLSINMSSYNQSPNKDGNTALLMSSNSNETG